MTTVSARLTPLACAGALALAGTAAFAVPAHAATSTPVNCSIVGTANNPSIATVLGLLGIVLPAGGYAGLNCTTPTPTMPVNFCAQTVYGGGLVDLGTPPFEDGRCP